MAEQHEMILILDFGSQYTQLIARRIREAKVYCEIVPYNANLNEFKNRNIKGYILSGGPDSALDEGTPRLDAQFYDVDIPILGVCYGMQLIALNYGGKLEQSLSREYGRAIFSPQNNTPLMDGLPVKSQVWMSHGDSIVKMPDGFKVAGSTDSIKIAAIANDEKKAYGLQFHPEVHHTVEGKNIISNFFTNSINFHKFFF